MLLNCPRPLAVETREVYHMARRQFALSGEDMDETRGAAMKLFCEEVSSWESGGHELLDDSVR
jgi:hypothetical protein